jgi:hypothetical protein
MKIIAALVLGILISIVSRMIDDSYLSGWIAGNLALVLFSAIMSA